MKKIIFAFLSMLLFNSVWAQEEERMFVAPWRETYFGFPSQTLGNKYTLTVYLPEEKVPLTRRYPVVYFLGLPRSEKEAAQAYARAHQLILLSVNLEEQDFRTIGPKLESFLKRDLIPYIDTNYYTDKDKRILAVSGENAAKAVLPLLQKKDIFEGVFFQHPASALADGSTLSNEVRVLVHGFQGELAVSSQALLQNGFVYGEGFALSYAMYESDKLSGLSAPYLLADQAQVSLKKISAKVGAKELPLVRGASVSLLVGTELKNGMCFVAVPQFVRTSPPYLDWDEELGMLSVRAGADVGTVTVTPVVDKLTVSQKIMLKKP